MTFKIRQFLFLITLALFFQNCKDEEPSCNASSITSATSANIEMRKTNQRCSDLDLLFDISFGVNLEFTVDIQCDQDCSGRRISYQKKEFHKTANGIIEINPDAESRAYYECNEISFPGQTLNTKAGDPMNYAVGDTIRFEFFNPNYCLEDNGRTCTSDLVPINLPDFSFEYILVPEDFDCN